MKTRSTMIEPKAGPALTITGIKRQWALRAAQWLADRGVLAFYNSAERALCAFETKHGRAWTYEAMHKALMAVQS